MTEIGKKVETVMTAKGRPATFTTHSLKELGEGNMQSGLARIAAYFAEENRISEKKGLNKGRIQGGVCVGLAMAALYGIPKLIVFVKEKQKKNKEHEDEGHAILDALDKASAAEKDITEESLKQRYKEESDKESRDL